MDVSVAKMLISGLELTLGTVTAQALGGRKVARSRWAGITIEGWWAACLPLLFLVTGIFNIKATEATLAMTRNVWKKGNPKFRPHVHHNRIIESIYCISFVKL